MDKGYEFLNYFKKILPKEEIEVFYKTHKIEEPKVILLSNIVTSLFTLIHDTYFGDELMGEDDKEKHFEWCWVKLTNDLMYVNVFLEDKLIFKKWIKETCFDIFYNVKCAEKEDIIINMKNLWETILDMNNLKTKSDVDLLIEIYKFYYI